MPSYLNLSIYSRINILRSKEYRLVRKWFKAFVKIFRKIFILLNQILSKANRETFKSFSEALSGIREFFFFCREARW